MSTKSNKKTFAKKYREFRPKTESTPKACPILTHGQKTNYPQWKEAMRGEVAMEYGLLVSIFDSGELLYPAEIDMDYDGDNDPHGLELMRLKSEIGSRQKQCARILEDMPKCRAYIWKYMSRESQEAVLGHADYDEEEHRNDCLQLVLSIQATHQGGGAVNEATRKAIARQTYRSLRQGPTESIADYKSNFSFYKKGYDDAGNVQLPDEDVAMDFFNGLDNARYAAFKADLENDRNKGTDAPQSLNDMFHRASNYVVPKTSWKSSGGAAFATRADDVGRGRGSGGRGRGSGRGGKGGRGGGGRGGKPAQDAKSEKSEPDKKSKKHKDVTCYSCGKLGHMSFACPDADEEDETAESGNGFATMCGYFGPLGSDGEMSDIIEDSGSESDDDEVPDLVSDESSDDEAPPKKTLSKQSTGRKRVKKGKQRGGVGRVLASSSKLAWSDVLLDNQADISVVNPRLLRNVRKKKSYVSGLSGTTELPYVGHLDGFFECKGSDNVIASVLCMSDVEDLYQVTYKQGESYTVHMEDGDLVFYQRNKLYVADMSDWEVPADSKALVTTVAENESRFSSLEVKRARQAKEMADNAGFSSEKDALSLVNDGNLTGVPVTTRDMKRAFEIYGKSAPGMRGRRTAHMASTQKVDKDLKSPHGELQVMYGDVAYFREKPYVMCLSEPLGLVTVTKVVNTKAPTLGAAVHSHISTIQSRGFLPTVLHLDPERGFAALDPHIPGVEVDISGAGDHMNALDVNIRHIKEIFRSTHASLPWKQPKWLDKDLVCYAVSRRNLRSTSKSAESPRVKFSGRKPSYAKELSIGYGDYVESYDPTVVSARAHKDRTEPCIALYPTGNANGSWWLLNIKTKKRVRRTNWVKMVTTELVINAMNSLSATEDDAEVEEEDVVPPLHVPDDPPETNNIDAQEQLTEEVEPPEGTESNEDTKDEPEADQDSQEQPAVVLQIMHKCASLVAGARRPMRYKCYHTSVRKGLADHGQDAYKAIVAELRQLLVEKKAMLPVHRQDLSARQLKKAIRSLMFLKTKFDGLGRFEKLKARLVANGKQQDRELYPDTYSPTVALQSVLMCLSIAAAQGRRVCAIDIGGAYLNADRKSEDGEEIIMELEPLLVTILAKVAPSIKPYVDDKGRLLVKLTKAMYGTLDAAKIWYEKLTGVLKDMGFEANEVDPCVMNKTINGTQCTILVYVDDLLVTCVSQEAINEVIQQLNEAFEGDVKSCTDTDLSYLGMHLKIEGASITVSMVAYLRGVLEELQVKGSVTSPATANLFVVNPASPSLSTAEAKKYHTTVAKLLYLAKRARVDVLLAVSYLCTRVKSPTRDDQVKLCRVLKYLHGTVEHVQVLRPSAGMLVEGYIDAAFGCHEDGKSHTGLIVTLGGCAVLCMSSKQKIVTRDSTEAELVGLSDKLMCVVKCYDFLVAQGLDIPVPKIFQDNTSTITLVTKGGGKYRTKYLRVRQAFTKECYECNSITIEYLATERMLADMLTKPLQGVLFRELARHVSGQ